MPYNVLDRLKRLAQLKQNVSLNVPPTYRVQRSIDCVSLYNLYEIIFKEKK